MKLVLKAALVASALGAATFLSAAPASAHDYRDSSVSVYVDFGNIAIAYRNGYFDHDRRWHSWRSRSHWRSYCRHPHARCYDRDYRHDRGRHRGWRNGRRR